jgi:3-deoxy-D-manno-octulosonic-acid transferase
MKRAFYLIVVDRHSEYIATTLESAKVQAVRAVEECPNATDIYIVKVVGMMTKQFEATEE